MFVYVRLKWVIVWYFSEFVCVYLCYFMYACVCLYVFACAFTLYPCTCINESTKYESKLSARACVRACVHLHT